MYACAQHTIETVRNDISQQHVKNAILGFKIKWSKQQHWWLMSPPLIWFYHSRHAYPCAPTCALLIRLSHLWRSCCWLRSCCGLRSGRRQSTGQRLWECRHATKMICRCWLRRWRGHCARDKLFHRPLLRRPRHFYQQRASCQVSRQLHKIYKIHCKTTMIIPAM